jgi:hypothetical protein
MRAAAAANKRTGNARAAACTMRAALSDDQLLGAALAGDSWSTYQSAWWTKGRRKRPDVDAAYFSRRTS